MTVRKRSVSIAGHRTSYSIEDPFQHALVELAALEGVSVAALIARIDAEKPFEANLSSALRMHVLAAARDGRLGAAADTTTGPYPRAASAPRPR